MIVNRAKAEEAAWTLAQAIRNVTTVEVADLVESRELSDWNVALVNAAYKTAVKATHPDAGGSPEAFARVDWAKHVLLAWLAKRPSAAPAMPVKGEDCPACQGTGTVWQRTGFKRGMKRMCGQCSGTGEQLDIDRTSEGL